jgi:Zn-dependent oligopeptidase
MTSNDVITYLHEFGHAIHGLASKTQLTRYAGTSTLRDFVELPSQCVENIFLTKKYLKLFTKHFQTGLPAPDELLDKIILADKCQQGSFNKRQLTFALTDQAMHNITDPDADTDANQVYSETLNRIMNFSPSKNTNFPATFGHLMGGYDSFYYGYLFSLSLAASVWDKIDKDNEKNGNEEAFKIYRTKVLQRGGSIDPNLIVEDFLGEKPTSGPFLKSLGL